MKTCLVTGATGFLGKYVVKELSKDREVCILSRRPYQGLKTFIFNLNDKDISFGDQSFNEVYHVAGLAHRVPRTPAEGQEFLDTNIAGTKNLLDALNKCPSLPESFVFISSVAVYGQDFGSHISETHGLDATEPYGVSKIEAEKMINDWGIEHHVRITILRLPLIAGQNPPGNLGAMIKGIQSGKYFRIGKGHARKSMVLASDVAAIMPASAEIGGIYNLTDGNHPSFAELEDGLAKLLGKEIKSIPMLVARMAALAGQIVQNITGKKMPINNRVLKKIIHPLTFSDEKARRELGWNPRHVVENLDELL